MRAWTHRRLLGPVACVAVAIGTLSAGPADPAPPFRFVARWGGRTKDLYAIALRP